MLPHIQFTRSYLLVSHPDTHRSRRVAEVRRHIVASVDEAGVAFCPWSRDRDAGEMVQWTISSGERRELERAAGPVPLLEKVS